MSLAFACAAYGQGVPASPASGPEQFRHAKRGWVSVGGGTANYAFGSGGAVRLAANFSSGRYLAMYRGSVALEDLDSSSSTESSIMGGFRNVHPNFYGTAAVGVARVDWSNGCPSFTSCQGAVTTALAFDLGVHASKTLAGLAFNLYGTGGPANTNILALTISAEIGWFGK